MIDCERKLRPPQFRQASRMPIGRRAVIGHGNKCTVLTNFTRSRTYPHWTGTDSDLCC